MELRLVLLGLFLFCLCAGPIRGYAQAAKTPDFIAAATVGNQFEISSSRTALQKSQNAQIRAFAQHMVDDHTRIGNVLKSLIDNSDAKLPEPMSDMDAKHQKLLDQLNATPEPAFDKIYINDQIAAHNDAVRLFRIYSQNGDNPAMKNFAADNLPTLLKHQADIREINGSAASK